MDRRGDGRFCTATAPLARYGARLEHLVAGGLERADAAVARRA
jgi:hypothetical protein